MTRAIWIAAAAALVGLAGCGKKPEPEQAAKAPDAASAGKPASTTPMAAAAPPARKPGLWEQTMSSGGRTQTSTICFDAAVDRKMAVWGQQAGKQDCQQSSVTPKPGGGWTFASTCDMGSSGRIVSTGEASGDFGSHYQVKATSTTTGAAVAQMNGTHEMVLDATWKGPCPPDMKPGDMTLPNGMKINMLTMSASMPGGK